MLKDGLDISWQLFPFQSLNTGLVQKRYCTKCGKTQDAIRTDAQTKTAVYSLVFSPIHLVIPLNIQHTLQNSYGRFGRYVLCIALSSC